MAVTTQIACDGPACDRAGFTVDPEWWMLTRTDPAAPPHHFCSTGCLLAWAAAEFKHGEGSGAGCSHRWHTIVGEPGRAAECPRCGDPVAANPQPGGARQ